MCNVLVPSRGAVPSVTRDCNYRLTPGTRCVLYCTVLHCTVLYCSRDKMVAAAEREKQLMLARPDILHPIDEKMLELAGGGVGLYIP